MIEFKPLRERFKVTSYIHIELHRRPNGHIYILPPNFIIRDSVIAEKYAKAMQDAADRMQLLIDEQAKTLEATCIDDNMPT